MRERSDGGVMTRSLWLICGQTRFCIAALICPASTLVFAWLARLLLAFPRLSLTDQFDVEISSL
jgi:hypothetical protein